MQEVSGSIPLSSTKPSQTKKYLPFGQSLLRISQAVRPDRLLQQRPHILPVDPALHGTAGTTFLHRPTFEISAA